MIPRTKTRAIVAKSSSRRESLTRAKLENAHRPRSIRILFVGESPPASGRFFYKEDSGLYRAIREAFYVAFPDLGTDGFLDSFQNLGCFLTDLCAEPVDRLGKSERLKACERGEAKLSRLLRRYQPAVVVVVVRSIVPNVKRSENEAHWSGLHVELPYPGRWHHHRIVFIESLVKLLRALDLRNKPARTQP